MGTIAARGRYALRVSMARVTILSGLRNPESGQGAGT